MPPLGVAGLAVLALAAAIGFRRIADLPGFGGGHLGAHRNRLSTLSRVDLVDDL